MCPPGLHITLGIFLRLFVLLEDACHQLDLSASLQGSDCGPSYERYSAALHKLTNIKDERLRLQNELNVLEQIITFTAATAANATSNPLFNNLASTVASMKEKKKHVRVLHNYHYVWSHGYNNICRKKRSKYLKIPLKRDSIKKKGHLLRGLTVH